jgi:protein TonB
MKRFILPLLILINVNLLAQIQEVDESFQKGKVENGQRIGKWDYYDKKEELALTFDYDSLRISYLQQDTSSYLIYQEDDWKSLKLDRQLRYLGSYAHLYDFLAMNLSSTYSADAGKKDINTIILLELEFNEKGKLIEEKIIGDHKQYFEEAILTVAESIPEYWIPAIYNGSTVNAKIAFPIIYTNKTDEKKQPKIEEIDYEGKIMLPIKIVGYGVRVRR